MALKNFVIFYVVFLFILPIYADSIITRGTEPGGVFLASAQYYYFDEGYYAVFYSPDNGETLIRRLFYNAPYGRRILSDAQPGVVYLYNGDTFDVSYDLGYTWDFVEVPAYNHPYYTSGTIPGEIYKWDTGIVYRSVNFGYDYEPLAEILSFIMLEVGIDDGEVYSLSTYPVWPPTGIYLLGYSSDYGASFTFTEIDTTIAGPPPFGSHTIYRGTGPGELFLVTRGLPNHFCIYHSIDYGQSFELKFQGEDYDPWNEGYGFTAGNEPGSFYIVKGISDYLPEQTNFHVTIFHSTDYGETYTEYYHYLDDTFENPAYTIVYPENRHVGYEEGSIDYNIASNIYWSIEYEAVWITSIEPDQGVNNCIFTVIYEENQSDSSRTAEIIIQGEGIPNQSAYLIQEYSTGLQGDSEIPLSQINIFNYPNPFNPSGAGRSPSTTISYDLPVNVVNPVIEIFNIKGEKVREFPIVSPSPSHQVSVTWDGTDNYQNPVGSGMYFYRLKTDNFISKAKKMILIK